VINFRYHVVSIVAVFLALAIGIVLGSTELHGFALDQLDSLSTSLRNSLETAHANNTTLKQQVNADQAFATAAAPRLLDGLLTEQKVVLVVAPSAPGNVVSGVTTALTQAGAKVTGQISLQPLLFDPSASNQSFLSTIVNTLATNSHVEPANGSPLAQASWMLGSAILTKNNPSSSGTQPGKSSGGAGTTGESVLSSYAQAGLLSVTSGQPGSDPATLAVVVTPSTIPSDGDSDSTNQGLVTMAQELNTAGLGTVMVGSVSGSVSGSAISTLRGSNAAAQISSVDDADTEIGQIVTVQALAQELSAGHKTGSYGVDPGNSAAGPNPAPTPATSTPATTTTTQVKSQGDAGKNSSTRKKT
jgi:Copper transport outer membrane protein, MctB